MAGRLHIHPNTVTQRPRRIEQLCEVDLTDPAVVLQFNGALTVQDVALIRCTCVGLTRDCRRVCVYRHCG